MPLRIPALRERPGDIVPLAEHALRRHARGAAPLELDAGARERLLEHRWPGNVRELENVMQRAAVLATGTVLHPDDLVFEQPDDRDAPSAPAAVAVAPALGEDLRERERRLILEALAASGSRKAAAQRLGISARTLRHKLQQMRAAGHAVPAASA
jgi:two-component system response regulator FlrC